MVVGLMEGYVVAVRVEGLLEEDTVVVGGQLHPGCGGGAR